MHFDKINENKEKERSKIAVLFLRLSVFSTIVFFLFFFQSILRFGKKTKIK